MSAFAALFRLNTALIVLAGAIAVWLVKAAWKALGAALYAAVWLLKAVFDVTAKVVSARPGR